MEDGKQKMLIVDTDCGVDDALALLLALSRHGKDWSLRAITCCRGVTDVQQVTSNVLKILNYVGITDIPVYRGCSKPIVDNAHFETDFHGSDGLGDVSSSLPLAEGQRVEADYASVALVQHVTQRPGQITLLAIGPLTNLAVAHRLEPQFSVYLKELYIMGGTSQGTGNVTPLSEFNIYVDPEAAHTVLTEFECPITIYPWEPCLEQPLPWAAFDAWMSKGTRVSKLVQRITAKSQQWDRDKDQRDGYLTPDPIAAACCLYPDRVIAASLRARGLAVELGGGHSRGLMVLDKRTPRAEDDASKSNAKLVTRVHMDALLQILAPVFEDFWLSKSKE